jgi:C-terminal processing protease CtpA/Prc
MKISILILSILFYVNVTGQNYLDKQMPKDSALADFDIFKTALISGHPGLYWYKSKEDITKSFNNAESQIKTGITNRDFHKLLTSVMNDISCGHSTVLYSKKYLSNIDTALMFFPFNVTKINKKLFITKVLNKTDIEKGSQLISINNKDINEIIEIIESKIPADKGINSKKNRSLDLLFSYYYTQFVENTNTFDIVIIDQYGNKKNKKVEAIYLDKNNMFHSPKEYAATRNPISYSVNNDIAELDIRTFGVGNYKNNNINYEDTISKIFQDLNSKGVKNLIIDLRGNNGGALGFSEYLYSYLIRKDIVFTKKILMNEDIAEGNFKYADLPRFLDMFQKEYGSLKKENNQYLIPTDSLTANKPYYKGNVYFLTDGLSFSATSNLLAVCKENKTGTIIGETPGGAYEGCNAGSPIIVSLPHSKFRLFFYIMGIRLNVNKEIKQIELDYEVSKNLDDIIKNTDNVKKYTIELINKK